MSEEKVRKFMSPNVVTARTSDTLGTLVARLRSNAISGCPVVDPTNHLVGVVSEVDLARVLSMGKGASSLAGFLEALLLATANETLDPLQTLLHRFRNMRVAACMTSPAIVASPDDSMAVAAALMRRHHINRLPIVEEHRIVGIVTRTDVLNCMAKQTDTASPGQATLTIQEVGA